jgi:hypothetical protein
MNQSQARVARAPSPAKIRESAHYTFSYSQSNVESM